MPYTQSELYASGETPINRAIMSLHAAEDAYRAMAAESAASGDVWNVYRYVSRSIAHAREVTRLEGELAARYR